MGSASLRYYFITDDDEILRVAVTKFDRLLKGFPLEKHERFSGERIRAAEIVVKIKSRKPVEVLRAIYYYLHFNEKGIIDYDRFMKDAIVVANAVIPSFFVEKAKGNVINAQQQFDERRRDHTVWWKPDMQLERNILDASIDEFKCKRV